MTMSRSIFRAIAALALLGALAACRKQAEPGIAPESSAQAPEGEVADFGRERVWQGVLPCSDCLGIDTRLVLRVDGNRRSYVLEETYLGASEPNRFEREGRWVETREGGDEAAATVYVLDPDRAPRRFRLEPDGGVQLLTGTATDDSVPEFRLQRL
jgi:copper homeostasis protein (lipoprotein)